LEEEKRSPQNRGEVIFSDFSGRRRAERVSRSLRVGGEERGKRKGNLLGRRCDREAHEAHRSGTRKEDIVSPEF